MAQRAVAESRLSGSVDSLGITDSYYNGDLFDFSTTPSIQPVQNQEACYQPIAEAISPSLQQQSQVTTIPDLAASSQQQLQNHSKKTIKRKMKAVTVDDTQTSTQPTKKKTKTESSSQSHANLQFVEENHHLQGKRGCYETVQAHIHSLSECIKTIRGIKRNLDSALSEKSSQAENILKTIVIDLQKQQQEKICGMCKKPPTSNPPKIKGVTCGHLFCCWECMGMYLEQMKKTQGESSFYCLYCNTAGPITVG